eukprot:jgi/Mesen1/10429/ME000082S09932
MLVHTSSRTIGNYLNKTFRMVPGISCNIASIHSSLISAPFFTSCQGYISSADSYRGESSKISGIVSTVSLQTQHYHTSRTSLIRPARLTEQKAHLVRKQASLFQSARGSTSVVFVHVSMADGSLRPLHATRLGFIGAGQMAEALAKGWDSAGILKFNQMYCSDVNVERVAAFQSLGVKACQDATEVAKHSDIIFIAVKPPVVKSVLTTLKESNSLKESHLIVSIAAGVTLDNMQSWAGEKARVVRVMPNTPCLVGQTAAAMSLGPFATGGDAELVRTMFDSVGTIHSIDEKLLDAVTGLSGSGPAYVFVAIEALADGGVAAGLPRDVAMSLATQTVLGSARLVLETGKHPAQLKDSVASPGGTTIAGLHELEKGGFRALLMNAVVAAANRSKEMSK